MTRIIENHQLYGEMIVDSKRAIGFCAFLNKQRKIMQAEADGDVEKGVYVHTTIPGQVGTELICLVFDADQEDN